jgi:cytochrome c-type biogenesis protein CcmH
VLLLWISFAALTAAVLACVLRPLFRAAASAGAAQSPEIAVYRDQLTELERDAARGLIDAAEAETAKTEIARRLLASDRQSQASAASSSSAQHSTAPYILAAATPLLALGLYLSLGAPNLPGRPAAELHAKKLDQNASVAELIARVESRLRAKPDDGEGWDVISLVYFKLERYDDAATAFANANRLLGESTKRLAGYAESRVFANNGIVTEDARRAYEKILAREPDRPEPRFWLALAQEQDGKFADAKAAYEALLKSNGSEAGWRATVEERIAAVDARLTGKAPAGPTRDDVQAAQKMSPEDRARMIAQMVDGLAARLKENANDLAGWQRLVNAYVVMGRRDDAVAALGTARKTFATDPKALADLKTLADNLGLGS